jgi:hypothetical protein
MKRFFLTTTVATVGLALCLVAQTRAGSHPGNGSGHPSGSANHTSSMSDRHGEHGHTFRANERFDYRRHGFKSLSWTRYGWSNFYRCYCYWAPRYGWCFYEPSYASYLPVSFYHDVYPEAAPIVSPVVSSTPAVIQQTTVVTAPPVPAADVPPPPPAPPITPAPTARFRRRRWVLACPNGQRSAVLETHRRRADSECGDTKSPLRVGPAPCRCTGAPLPRKD